jgi:hypothetical protein
MNPKTLKWFAEALKTFNMTKTPWATRQLLDASNQLQSEVPEASDALTIIIKNLQTRLERSATQQSLLLRQRQHQIGEPTTDFTQTLLQPDQLESFAAIVGYAEVKQRICQLILEPLVDPLWKKGGVRTGVVLYGPGGTGKSLFAKALAGESKTPVFFVTESNIQSKWVGGSQRNMKALLDMAAVYAKKHGGAIIFFDEGDTLFGTESTYGQGVVNEFKNRHDLINKLNIATIVATNHPAALRDTGLKRRLGEGIYVGMPNYTDNKEKVVKGKCLGNVINIGANDMYNIMIFYMKKTGSAEVEPNFTLAQFRQLLDKFPKLKLLTADNIRALVEKAESVNPLGRGNYRELYYCPIADDKFEPLLKKTSDKCRQYDKSWTAAEIARIQWPPVRMEDISSIFEIGVFVSTTTPNDLREYLSYAEFLPDDLSVSRIEEDLAKFGAKKEPSIQAPPSKPAPKQGWFW